MSLRTRGLAGLAMALAIGGAMAGIDVQDAMRGESTKRGRNPTFNRSSKKRNRPEHIRKQREKNTKASKARAKNKGR